MWSRLLSVNQQSEGYILVLLSPIVLIPTMQNNQVHSWIIPLLLLVFFWRKKQNKQKTCRELQGFICAEIWDLSCLEGQRISSCWITTVIQSEATAAWGTNAALIDWCAKQRTDRRQASKNQRKKPIALSSPSTLDNFWIFIALFGVYPSTVSPPFYCTSLSQSVCSSLLIYLLFFPFFLPDDFFQYCRFTIGAPWFYSGPIFIRSSWNTLSLYSLIYTKNVFI